MSNHIHLVATPEEPQSLAMALRRTHGRYALYLNSRRHRVGHLWQNRFYSCALDETHLWAALRYAERNPVRAQLVMRPGEYAWSSAAAHLGTNAPSTLLDWQFYTTSGGRERWIALLAEPEELAAIRALQRGTFTGRPVGSPEFVARLEQELGRLLTRRQGQRPRSESVLAVPQ
jgi:putative transposase